MLGVQERFGRRVLRLPSSGVLLFATDLQGNFGDYERMKVLYLAEKASGNEPFLLFAGDLVHGPSPDMNEPDAWPDHLGTAYVDRSRDIVLDYLAFSREENTASLLGNHEHAHIGGPRVAKFFDDEAAVLDRALGDDAPKAHAFFRSFPLIAASASGARFAHACPRDTAADLESFEELSYEGFEKVNINDMYDRGPVGALLWSRMAAPERARAFLAATAVDGQTEGFVGYGHDVVDEGYEKVGDEQICVSTSYGCFDKDKVYLRLDLAARYKSVAALEEGREILPLYPDTA
jgi:hypothetical protein